MKHKISFVVVLILLLAAEIAGRFCSPPWFAQAEVIFTRILGAAVFYVLIREMGYRVRKVQRSKKSAWILVLAGLVAVNNLPIYSLVTGRAAIHASAGQILLFAVECLAVGCFEELAFRGFLLPFLLSKSKGRAHTAFRAAFFSSLIFSLIHLVNLFDGASPGAVLMQIGYTFLVGGMCAVVLVATKSVWLCAVIHAVYNFCGTIVPRLGETQGWDVPTVIVTAVLAACTCVLFVRYLFRNDAEAEKLIGI